MTSATRQRDEAVVATSDMGAVERIASDKARRELGWPQLLAALADLTRTPVGREVAFELSFKPTREEVLVHLGRVAEARRLTLQAQEIPLADTPDVRSHLLRASREGVLEPRAILDCARLIRSASRVRRFLQARREVAPALAGEAEVLSEFDPLAAEIERAIEPAGTVSDQASPLLAELRERTRALHRNIKTRIDELLEDDQLEDVLRDRYYSVRDERYVLPVKTQHKARLPGIVHNASQSGQTLFVEPEQLMDLGNQLTIARAMEVEEERRILRDLSDGIGRRAEDLGRDIGVLAELDRVSAGARLSDRLNASEPRLAAAGESFDLRGLSHPLLLLRGVPVVANDVRIDPGRRCLIISGPNSGGKTVTVTAVGLSALMLRAGLPIPAGPDSALPLYASVHTAIGDEGDLALDLSTFTAHLTALRDIAAQNLSDALVCIDEIAADTDPREGAALAIALLEEVVERGGQVLITTHLDEVKAKGLSDPRFMSASVTFDTEKLAPTYRLRLNHIGASSAIEIARRVGLPEAICQRAREILGGSTGSLDEAIRTLETARAEAQQQAAALETERARAEQARHELERQRLSLEQKEREVTAEARRDLIAEVERVRGQVRAMLASLQEGPTVRAAVQAQKELEAVAEEQKAIDAKEQVVREAEATGQTAATVELRVGQRVQLVSMGREGEILEIAGDLATVAMGALKTRAPLVDLVPLTGKTSNAATFRRTAAEVNRAARKIGAGALPSQGRTIDVRGLRADDALRELRTVLDRLVREDLREATIIHGHGSGALKKAVREELESSPYADSFRPGEPHEGGDGVTVVALRGTPRR
jgi:DNA mismatch repair protein MutS2